MAQHIFQLYSYSYMAAESVPVADVQAEAATTVWQVHALAIDEPFKKELLDFVQRKNCYKEDYGSQLPQYGSRLDILCDRLASYASRERQEQIAFMVGDRGDFAYRDDYSIFHWMKDSHKIHGHYITPLVEALSDTFVVDHPFSEEAQKLLDEYSTTQNQRNLGRIGLIFGPKYCTQSHLDAMKSLMHLPEDVSTSIKSLADLIIHMESRYMISGYDYQQLSSCLQQADRVVQSNVPERSLQTTFFASIMKGADSEMPDYFLCPITQTPMEDPVIDPDGNSYERKAILKSLERKQESPLTRRPFKKEDLRENRALKEAIEDFKKFCEKMK